jgi:hypothetical protein
MGRCAVGFRVGQEIEHRVQVDVARAGRFGDPCEPDAAVFPTDERQGWRYRIDPPDRDPALEQQRRRAEPDLDLRQRTEQPAIAVPHAHADCAQIERLILAQTQLRVVNIDREVLRAQFSLDVRGHPRDGDRARHQEPDETAERKRCHRNQQ